MKTPSELCVQCALLYTTPCGQRLLRVHTLSYPVTNDVPSVVHSYDADTVAALFVKQLCCTVRRLALAASNAAQAEAEAEAEAHAHAHAQAGAFKFNGANQAASNGYGYGYPNQGGRAYQGARAEEGKDFGAALRTLHFPIVDSVIASLTAYQRTARKVRYGTVRCGVDPPTPTRTCWTPAGGTRMHLLNTHLLNTQLLNTLQGSFTRTHAFAKHTC